MEGTNQNDELYPIAVLMDELKVRTHGMEAMTLEGLHNIA